MWFLRSLLTSVKKLVVAQSYHRCKKIYNFRSSEGILLKFRYSIGNSVISNSGKIRLNPIRIWFLRAFYRRSKTQLFHKIASAKKIITSDRLKVSSWNVCTVQKTLVAFVFCPATFLIFLASSVTTSSYFLVSEIWCFLYYIIKLWSWGMNNSRMQKHKSKHRWNIHNGSVGKAADEIGHNWEKSTLYNTKHQSDRISLIRNVVL